MTNETPLKAITEHEERAKELVDAGNVLWLAENNADLPVILTKVELTGKPSGRRYILAVDPDVYESTFDIDDIYSDFSSVWSYLVYCRSNRVFEVR